MATKLLRFSRPKKAIGTTNHSGFAWALYDLQLHLPRLFWNQNGGVIEGRAVPTGDVIITLRPVREGEQWQALMMGHENRNLFQFPHRAVIRMFRLVGLKMDERIEAAQRELDKAERDLRAFRVMEGSLLHVKPRPDKKGKQSQPTSVTHPPSPPLAPSPITNP